MAKVGILVKNLSSGGAEKQAVLLANALASRHDVHFIILNGEKVNGRYLHMLDSAHLTTHTFGGSKRSRLEGLKKLMVDERLDIVFSYLTAANCYASLAARGTQTKVVTGLRNARLPLAKHIIDSILTNFLATASIANCYSGRDFFARTGFRRKRIHVIPNCYADISSTPHEEHSDTVTIISVGRFVPQKDYETAIRAVVLLRMGNPAMRLMIVGYGELEDKIRGWVDQHGISDITDIRIDPDNIDELLGNADIYLSTSLFEGTSNSIMEAMNAQLPIVATEVGDNGRLVADGLNGYLVRPKAPKEIAEALSRLLNNPSLRREMGIHSREILIENHSVDTFRDKYLSLISDLLATGN